MALTSGTLAPGEPDQAPALRAASRRLRLRSTARTFVLYAVTLFAVVTVIFAIPRAMPGDPIQAREDPTDSLYVSDSAARERSGFSRESRSG